MTTRKVELEYLKARVARTLFGKKRARARRPKSTRESTTSVAARTSRDALAVLTTDCTSFIEGASRQAQRGISFITQQRPSVRKVWLPSFIALGSADVALASATATRSSLGLEAVGAAGGLGLIGVSTVNLWRARTSEEALDAAADLAWGVQGFSYVTGAARVAPLTTGMGFVGAAARMSVGVIRIRRGVKTGDKEAVKLGTLDVGAGALWGALDVAGFSHPLVLGGYVAAMVCREVYANKSALRQVLLSDVGALLSPARRTLHQILPRARWWTVS